MYVYQVIIVARRLYNTVQCCTFYQPDDRSRHHPTSIMTLSNVIPIHLVIRLAYPRPLQNLLWISLESLRALLSTLISYLTTPVPWIHCSISSFFLPSINLQLSLMMMSFGFLSTHVPYIALTRQSLSYLIHLSQRSLPSRFFLLA
jgi:hypothetical protein